MEYEERATEDLTPQHAKSNSKAGGFANERGDALRRSGVSEHAGFPNPATDRSQQNLDLNTLLIRHPAATYLMRIEGSDWRALGIFDKDIVVVDRALGAATNDLVIWWQGESFTISHKNRVPKDIEVWGVVSATIHRFRAPNLRPTRPQP